MIVKLTPAQEKLVKALQAAPGTDAMEHLQHLRNKMIADDMIAKLIKFGILWRNPQNQRIELKPKDQLKEEISLPTTVAAPETGTDITVASEIENQDESAQTHKMNKKAIILEMLQKGCSLADMVLVTQWLEKSVRGVMSQLKKEKGLVICRKKNENKQNYYYIENPTTA